MLDDIERLAKLLRAGVPRLRRLQLTTIGWPWSEHLEHVFADLMIPQELRTFSRTLALQYRLTYCPLCRLASSIG